MPESLFQPDRDIRIQELTIAAPTPENMGPDSEYEVPDERWERIKATLDSVETEDPRFYPQFVNLLADICLALPERAKELAYLNPTNDQFNAQLIVMLSGMFSAWKDHRLNESEYVQALRSVRIIAPAALGPVNAAVHYAVIEARNLETYERLYLHAAANQAFPGDFSDDIDFHLDSYVKLCDQYKKEYEQSLQNPSPYPSLEFYNYLSTLYCLRLAAPDRLAELQPIHQVWRDLEYTTQTALSASDGYVHNLVEHKVLSAKQIIIDQQGVQLILPVERPGDDGEPAPLPEQRRY